MSKIDATVEAARDKHEMHVRIDELEEGDVAILVTRSTHVIGTDLFGTDLDVVDIVALLETAKYAQLRDHLSPHDDHS